MNFSRGLTHEFLYFLLYKIIDRNVYVTNMFHFLEDFENKLR